MNDQKSTRRQKTEDRRQKAEACPERSRRDKSLFSVLCPLSSVLCVFMLAGCAKQQRYETIDKICVPDIDKAEAMQIAEDVLAKMCFTIEKADANSGLIKTRPLPGAQFFEFWRRDNVGAFNTMEANLQSIRRTAQLNIRQKTEDRQQKTEERNLTLRLRSGQASDICPLTSVLYISCDVQVQRLSIPNFEYRISNIEFPTNGGMEWIDVGKDTQLATEILKRIEQQMTSDKRRATSDE